jgi:hypothetical protein
VAEKGIFTLRTAKDLFGKLERDLKRVKEARLIHTRHSISL